MRLFTVTLNPALDIHLFASRFKEGTECTAESSLVSAGGKGVNVSKALAAFGIESEAHLLLGKENRERYLAALGDLPPLVITEREGSARENITIHAPGGETRVSLAGENASVDDLCRVFAGIDAADGDILAFSGSLPPGVGEEDALALLLPLKKRGVRLIADSRSLSAASLKRLMPYLIKPNEPELCALVNDPDPDPADASVRLRGVLAENVLVTLGGRGAYLAAGTCEAPLFREAPELTPLSTIGAGDAAVAGFMAGLYRGLDEDACLHHAVAFGSAACLSQGTEPPTAAAIRRFLQV